MEQKREKKAQKLNLSLVAEIRKLYGEGHTQGALARHFGVSVGQIGRIVRGESWQANTGARMPTQAEQDAMLERVWLLQKQVELAPELVKQERKPPPMLLEGGDAPEEGTGEGLSEIQKRAAAMGVDVRRISDTKKLDPLDELGDA